MKRIVILAVVLIVIASAVDGKKGIGFVPKDTRETKAEESAYVRDISSGSCGERVMWWYDNITRTLIINGTGTMSDYPSSSAVPWKGAIRTVIVEEGVTSIGENAFFNSGVSNISFSSTVTSLGANSFAHCSGLRNIAFPPALTSIGDYAFAQSGLLPFTIPASVTSIGQGAFAMMSLEVFTVDENNPAYMSIDGVIFNRGKWNLVAFPCGGPTNYTIPDHVTTINAYAFSGCSRIRSLVFPSSVTTIGEAAFSYLYYMTSFNLPPSVTHIDDYAFHTCGRLQSLTLPASVAYLGEEIFTDSSVSSVTFLGNKPPQCSNLTLPDKLRNLCVAIDYQSSSFCGAEVSADPSTFGHLRDQHNSCYEVVMCNDGNFSVQKRATATEWEAQVSECFEYQCDNESGHSALSMCDMSEGNGFCLDGKCAKKDVIEEKGVYAVEILFDDLSSKDLNMKKALFSISNASGVDEKYMKIGVEIDDDGKILRVILLLYDEIDAQKVINAINNLDKNTACTFDAILCRRKEARLAEVEELTLSCSSRNNSIIMLVTMIMMMVLGIACYH